MNFSNFDFQLTAPLSYVTKNARLFPPHQGHLTLPGTIIIYNMGWRLASRAICPATLSDLRTAETVPVTTPPCHILRTNQETLTHQGPSPSGHI
ncbi:hypothetical protein TNCV_4740901 [Trichonephila clavipes]|nr:hypothetical protein TNCV_4740901 [Trichonephila clavipes]